MTEVERDALFVPVEALEIHAILFGGVGGHIPSNITTGLRVLHFNDFRSKVSEMDRAPWACTVLLKSEYSDSFQWRTCSHVAAKAVLAVFWVAQKPDYLLAVCTPLNQEGACDLSTCPLLVSVFIY